ncbi:MAG TPA: hypothetical protein VGV59_13825 [Pyrinomonadaceae bacterium]|nr:hypothetical protein [Pyrinomonadaceae bacterium]
MIKNLSQKLVVIAFVVLAAGAAGAHVAAQTNTVSAVFDVAPGERRCLTHPTRAERNASVEDYVLAGAPVKFLFLLKRDTDPEFSEISNSGTYPVMSYSTTVSAPPSFPPSFFPSLFPATFRTCARNTSTQPSTVSLSITVDK